jgi:hypothetical protein
MVKVNRAIYPLGKNIPPFAVDDPFSHKVVEDSLWVISMIAWR